MIAIITGILLAACVMTVPVLFAVASVTRMLARRRNRRRYARERHPVSRPVPGLPDDGEPLDEAELREYMGIVFASWFRPEREPERPS